MIIGSTKHREMLLKMYTKRCEKCGQLWGVDGSHVCPTQQPEDLAILAVIARQEVDLERLRVANKQLREVLSSTIKVLDAARDAINKTIPYGYH